MRFNLLLLVVINYLIMFVSCDNKNDYPKETNILLIDIKKDYSDIRIDSCNTNNNIWLEDNENSLIVNPGKTLFYDGVFYILDLEYSHVLLFNKSGKYIDKIGNFGKGPGEYERIYDINFNYDFSKLELLSPNGKVVSYDLQSKIMETEFIADVRSVSHFANLNNDIVIFYSLYEDYRIMFYSRKNNEFVNRDLPCDPNLCGRVRQRYPTSPFYLEFLEGSNAQLKFIDPLTGTIYRVTRNGIKPVLNISFGENDFIISNVPEEAKNDIYYFREYLKEGNISYPPYALYEDEKYLFFTTIVGQESSKSIIYNKREKSYNLVSFPVKYFFIPVVASERNTLYGCFINGDYYNEYITDVVNETCSFELVSGFEWNHLIVEFNLEIVSLK